MLSCPYWGAQFMSSRRFHELGLFYGAIPVLAGAYSAYEVSSTQLERQHAVSWLTIFVPRLSLTLILALMVYGAFRAVGSVLVRLHGVALAAQPTWRFITSKP
jgi:ABC-type Na+ efflux pump permease subunit